MEFIDRVVIATFEIARFVRSVVTYSTRHVWANLSNPARNRTICVSSRVQPT